MKLKSSDSWKPHATRHYVPRSAPISAPNGGLPQRSRLACTLAHVVARLLQCEREALGSAYKGGDLVFGRPDGSFVQPWNYAAAVKDLAQRAGVRSISLHDLRDTHASLLAANGVPLEVVSKRLGHSSIGATAERYLHVYTDRDAAAASVFDTLCG